MYSEPGWISKRWTIVSHLSRCNWAVAVRFTATKLLLQVHKCWSAQRDSVQLSVREHPLQLTDPPSRQISPYVDIFASGILKLVFKDFRKTESCKPLAASYMVNISCASASLFLGMAFLRAVFAASCYFFGQIYLICFLDAYLRGVQLVECQQEATRRGQ